MWPTVTTHGPEALSLSLSNVPKSSFTIWTQIASLNFGAREKCYLLKNLHKWDPQWQLIFQKFFFLLRLVFRNLLSSISFSIWMRIRCQRCIGYPSIWPKANATSCTHKDSRIFHTNLPHLVSLQLSSYLSKPLSSPFAFPPRSLSFPCYL